MVEFLIWVAIIQVCSLCRNLLTCTLRICALSHRSGILQLKKNSQERGNCFRGIKKTRRWEGNRRQIKILHTGGLAAAR